MSFLNSLNIAGSALTAQRVRIETITQNLANIATTRTENGGPYARKLVVMEEKTLDFDVILGQRRSSKKQGGVQVREIIESEKDFIPVYNPEHPDANEEGYVLMPNVDRTEEQVDLMAATRAYEANITSLNVVKVMTMKAMEIGK